MNKEEIQELIDYNLEYLEARNSEEIFGGDYTSEVDLKYANKTIDKLQQENKKLQTSANSCKQRIDKALNELDKLNIKLKEILSIGIDIKEISDIEKILKGDSNE